MCLCHIWYTFDCSNREGQGRYVQVIAYPVVSAVPVQESLPGFVLLCITECEVTGFQTATNHNQVCVLGALRAPLQTGSELNLFTLWDTPLSAGDS